MNNYVIRLMDSSLEIQTKLLSIWKERARDKLEKLPHKMLKEKEELLKKKSIRMKKS